MIHRVVVTGLGIITPLGRTVSSTWQAITSGNCGIRSTDLLGPPYASLASRVAAWILDSEIEDFLAKVIIYVSRMNDLE